MKVLSLMAVPLVLVGTCLIASAEPTQVRIDAVFKSVRTTGEGDQETDILSTPSMSTISGTEGSIKVVTEFSTSVPGHEELTKQNGDAGIILTATPYLVDAGILLKGNMRVAGEPVKQTLDSGVGETAVQESVSAQFSLKLGRAGQPVEVGPMSLTGGRQLVLVLK